MPKKTLIPSTSIQDRSFELLIASALNSLKEQDLSYLSQEAAYLLSKPELIQLVRNFQPQDPIELLLILQFLIGYLLSIDRLSHGSGFEPFTNLSLRAGDLLMRYKAFQLKKTSKNAIPHEPS